MIVDPMKLLDRTRGVLFELQQEQEQLGAELEATGLQGFSERADWLIAHRSTDQRLAWERHWASLGIPNPAPRRRRRSGPRRLTADEVLSELGWLLSNGSTEWEAARSLGRSMDSLSRLAYRHGCHTLGARMEPRWNERKAS